MAVMTQPETMTPGLSPGNLAYLCQVVYQEAGIVLDESKRYLLDARLKPLAQEYGLGTIDQLCTRLHGDGRGPLRRRVVEALTTNETLFFRDVAPFEALKTTILPELLQKRGQKRALSIWCAACSSGQEPYSLAMLLRELLPDIDTWKLNLLGTDLSEGILERARQAKYFQLEVNRGLPVKFLVKYFTRKHLDWELRPEIRRMVRFQTLNLKEDFQHLGCFDLVLCRNVMIYFNVDLKKRILAGIRGVLAPDGYLLLGGAETVYSLDDNYEHRVVGEATMYHRK